jgi:uncharacterized protein (TIGR01777 family)
MRVAVTGSSGLIGTRLVSSLVAAGHDVVRVTRGAGPDPGDGTTNLRWDPMAGTIDAAGLAGTDAVIHLAGAGIGDHRWTPDYRRLVLESRSRGTAVLARALADMATPPAVLLSGSATGYYGERGDDLLTEADPPGDLFLSQVCVAWEEAAAPAADAGVRVARLRTGLVLDAGGGALTPLLRLFRLGLGGRLGSGRQWWSWITLDDHVAALLFLLQHEISGPVNLVGPVPATNADFTAALGTVLRRPTVLAVPAFGPRLVLGRQLADELLFSSQRVEPTVLQANGFPFAHPDLDGALRAVLNR